jgi:hypothetical protein
MYEKGKIYKITCNNETFYGSTIDDLDKLFIRLVDYYKGKLKNSPLYILFDKYGYENCKIELVENYPTSTFNNLRNREMDYVLNNNCVNRIPVELIRKELPVDDSDKEQKKKERVKAWRFRNRDKINETHRKYIEEHKDKFREYQRNYQKNKRLRNKSPENIDS